MKQAILLHGTGGSDTDYFWFEDTKKFLEVNGYKVWWPLMPHTDRPTLQDSLGFLNKNIPKLDQESIVIAHSSACPLVLSFFETLQTPIKQTILVSGYYVSIDDQGFSELMLQKNEYNWDVIKKAAGEIVVINSDNDPWGCNDKQAMPVAEKLAAEFILAEGQGHMGSSSWNQPYREFRMLKNLIKI